MTSKSVQKTGSRNDNAIINWIGIIIFSSVIFIAGIFVGQYVIPRSNIARTSSFLAGTTMSSKPSSAFNEDLFWTVWNLVKNGYVDEKSVDEKEMFYGSIKGAVASIGDPNNVFLSPEETEMFNDSSQGKLFEGIGAELSYGQNGVITVVSPLDGSPAYKAGIRPADVILKVDGKDISGMSIYEVVNIIRGKAGTTVVLTVLHEGEVTPTDISIVRGPITVPSMELKDVKGHDDIKVLDVSRFTDKSLGAWENEWNRMVQEFKASGADKLILDLRGNPGGFFDAAVYAAGEFLPKGTLVAKQRSRSGDSVDFKVDRRGQLLDVPVVILVNKGSASASEILSGALKINNRAKVIGTKTYGKGTAQKVIDFADGSSLHLTVMKWILPDDTWINRENPITPDVEVEFSQDEFKQGRDSQLNKAIEILLTK